MLQNEALGIYELDKDKQDEHRSLMTAEINETLQNWEVLQLKGSEVLQLIRFAEERSISLDAINRDAIYQSAVLNASNVAACCDYCFVNWAQDAYAELIVTNASGVVSYYTLGETWEPIFVYETGLSSPAIKVIDSSKPMVVIVSEEKDAFGVFSGQDNGLTPLFFENDVVDIELRESELNFARIMPGSILRRTLYRWNAGSPDVHPQNISIDWQQDSYPYPADAESLICRWLEALLYGIDEERALLVGTESYEALGFSTAALVSVPVPDSAECISVQAYYYNNAIALTEAVYISSGKEVRRFFAASAEADEWKVAGVSEKFSSNVDEWTDEQALPLLALNRETTAQLKTKTSVHNYRVFLPEQAQLNLLWQAGTKTQSSVAYTVSIYAAEQLTQPVISYDLSLSVNQQLSHPLFLTPGVYYVSVKTRISTDTPYTLTLSVKPNSYIESESNNTIPDADRIEPNKKFTGTLFNARDVDCYKFSLAKPGCVQIFMSAENENMRSERYSVAAAPVTTGIQLTAFSMSGAEQFAQSGKLYLAAGDYVVQISKGKYHSAAAYELTVSYHETISAEQEGAAFTEIQLNTDMTGSFGTENDEDLFTFTLGNDSVVQPKLSFLPLENNTKACTISIMQGAETKYSANIGGMESNKTLIPVALQAGTYTLKLKSSRLSLREYNLHIAASSVANAECEPNNALAQACPLPLKTEFSGVLSGEDDVDLYRVTLTEETSASLCFHFPTSVVEGSVYTVRLEHNGKSQWSTNVKGASGGFEQAMRFPAGEYYIRIKASTWIGAVYAIELK